MKTINVSLQNSNYPVYIGKDIIKSISSLFSFENYSSIIIITDTNIEPLFASSIVNNINQKKVHIISIKAGEKEKNIENITKIWNELLDKKIDRKSLIVALGGGVVCDIAGFIASTYMRGISFITVPTTLLSQVDASIGGKTGFNLNDSKNIIGTFYQPEAVFIDTNTLKTLHDREYHSGYAEIIKHGLIADNSYFYDCSKKFSENLSDNDLIDIVERSIKIKSEIVSSDICEKNGKRKVLNFGHTIGHAIESIRLKSDFPLLHGEAISIGICAESHISYSMGMISLDDVLSIKHALMHSHLPVNLPDINLDILKNYIISDKKNENGTIKWVLIEKIGKACYDMSVPNEYVDEALQFIIAI